ncbi:MAG: YifB family Mg chelatase-like AAA ATPase [Gemmatimonadota bacterium]|nr:MAG: YifB family Mg chelatase-like AAA ATPase [Gemmatimonadota bacterium]
MLARVRSAAILGIDAYIVAVEVDAAPGLPAMATVGLAQSAVKEGRERVLAALVNSGYEVPPRKITINLAPADIKKEGSHFDLPIACGLLAATGQIRGGRLERYALAGELGLDGALRPIRGALSMTQAVAAERLAGFVVPTANLSEAAILDGVDVRGATCLAEVTAFLDGRSELPGREVETGSLLQRRRSSSVDLADVRGQRLAKRALEIAAAGAHNVLLIGPPGGGKTMLARRLPTILPGMSLLEATEVTRIHSVAGLLPPNCGLVTERPFRAPHHTISDAGLVGGGALPRPGEVSLAHNGVLFLDELTEFRRNVLEALRQPLEDGVVTIGRASRSLTYPARLVLAAAMNPCHCGLLGDSGKTCRCTPRMIQRYRSKVSGPLLDRIDLQIEVPPVTSPELLDSLDGESSAAVAARVEAARRLQLARFEGRAGLYANGQMGARDVRLYCRADDTGLSLLRSAMARFGLSARSFHRVLKIARTIADLEASEAVRASHVAEAIQYRGLDRRA